MRPLGICYYPTKTLFVDDNVFFLDLLPGTLNGPEAYLKFSDPRDAINYINKPIKNQTFNMTDRFGPKMEAISSQLLAKANDPNRTAEPSVVLVDYSMGTINGLELCKQIENPHIKKILITGVASEETVKTAIQDNIIDYCIMKHAPELMRTNELVSKCQYEYLDSLFREEKEQLDINDMLSDPVFIDYFNTLCQKHDIQEYYFIKEISGFLMISSTKESFKLLVYDQQKLQEQKNIAVSKGASERIVHAIEIGESIPFFYEKENNNYIENKLNIYPAENIQGKKQYYSSFTPFTLE